MQRKSNNLYIITGASRGLGKELFLEIKNNEDAIVLLVSRNKKMLDLMHKEYSNDKLDIYVLPADVSSDDFDVKFKKEIDRIKENHRDINKVYLFNNASTVLPIKQLINTTREDQFKTINVNLSSTIWITSEVLRLAKLLILDELYIVNVSTGISFNPIEGWSLYCISKAGLNMLTSSVVKETRDWPFKVFCISVNPGAMNTDMQKTIRNSEIEESPTIRKFIDMHKNQNLTDPHESAHRIINIIDNKLFENGEFIDFNRI